MNSEKISKYLKQLDEGIWELSTDFKPHMRVPGRIYGTEKIINDIKKDRTLEQCANVASLPGIKSYSIVLPDGHEGYGFPIGGVAATDYYEGVISPGGVGFDINCGVRLIRTNLTIDDVRPVSRKLIDALYENIPSGVGSDGYIEIYEKELDGVLEDGAEWAVEKGFGWEEDLEKIEENGKIEFADPLKVSQKAKKRGKSQLGTLGSGNHFLEVEYVDKIYNEKISKKYGITEIGQIVIMIHTGSRGLGHQVCTDYLTNINKKFKNYWSTIPDRELVYVPTMSKEGMDYFSAMCAAANYAWANREIITHEVRNTFEKIFEDNAEALEMDTVYDLAHNILKLETHKINGKKHKLYIHRKGATRAFGPENMEIPKIYRDVGQPVLIPGNMQSGSYLLSGTKRAMDETFGSTCHGAGRRMSRTRARKNYRGKQIIEKLYKEGIYVKSRSSAIIAEEAPQVYKEIDEVIKSVEIAGISKAVARLRPLGVIKG